MMGLGYAAGGAADALQQLIAAKRLEQMQQAQQQQQAGRDAIAADDHQMRRREHERLMTTPQAGEKPMLMSAGQQIVDPTTGKVIFAAPTAAPAAPRPMAVGGRLVDPSTGKVIYEAPPEAPAPAHPVSVAPGGRLVDPMTGKVVFAAPERQTAGPTPAQAVKVAQAQQQQTQQQTQQQNDVTDSIALIDELLNDGALNESVGPIDSVANSGFAGYIGRARDASGINRFNAKHDQVVGKLSLAQAGKLKGQGPVSDSERKMLGAASTALSTNMSEADYRAELGKIREQFKRMQGGGGGAVPGAPAMMRARDPQGNLHEAPAGTALPAGWKAEG